MKPQFRKAKLLIGVENEILILIEAIGYQSEKNISAKPRFANIFIFSTMRKVSSWSSVGWKLCLQGSNSPRYISDFISKA